MRQPWAQGGQGHNVGIWMWNVSNRLKWLTIWCQHEMGLGLIVHFYFLYLPECIWNIPQFCFNVFPINPSLSCSLSGIWYQRWENKTITTTMNTGHAMALSHLEIRATVIITGDPQKIEPVIVFHRRGWRGSSELHLRFPLLIGSGCMWFWSSHVQSRAVLDYMGSRRFTEGKIQVHSASGRCLWCNMYLCWAGLSVILLFEGHP